MLDLSHTFPFLSCVHECYQGCCVLIYRVGGRERGRGGRRKFVRHYSFQKKTGNLCDGLVFLGRGGLYWITTYNWFLVILYFYIWFGFLCAQFSSGNCETTESWKFALLSPKPRSDVRTLIYRTWAEYFADIAPLQFKQHSKTGNGSKQRNPQTT